MARTVVARADVVVAVGTSGIKGLHGLVRTVRDLLEPRRRTRANRGRGEPRASPSPVARRDVASAGRPHRHHGHRPGHGPDLRRRTRARSTSCSVTGSAPAGECHAPLVGAVHAVLQRSGPRPVRAGAGPTRVVPGSLGPWTDGEAANQ